MVIIYLFNPLAVLSILSAVWIDFDLASYPLCPAIMATISSITLTFEPSRKLLTVVPKPSSPGVPSVASPDPSVGRKRLFPTAKRPAGLTKELMRMFSVARISSPAPKIQALPALRLSLHLLYFHRPVAEEIVSLFSVHQ